MSDRRLIIDRIEKLYALASGGTSPGEAAAAISMAEKLMKKYSIGEREVNKNRYQQGSKESRSYKRPESPKSSREPFWRRKYNQESINSGPVKADLMRESDKAYLINVHLNENKYPGARLSVKVSIWIPKSKVITHMGNIWVVDIPMLMRNLENNKPWLRANHPVFKSMQDIEFHLKAIV